ncbi:NLR family CARD domain-containing protein 4 [Holothuria leucospilota]|uniref:NLR family CARD domain-containing protein 4 n=1 Tax=Holothuria leucospilota TaxID=206669 RepID=A0A9Q1BS78_HOLLE|nr:NLR family CARD domain-containing protein 4 [Holothuria leucospilota]
MHLMECMMSTLLPLILVLPLIHFRETGAAAVRCDSPQYLDFGKVGAITCFFHEDFYAVFWYTAADLLSNIPTLRYQNGVKAGSGYETGEFDVHANGSLIIRNVSLDHNELFTVAYIRFKEESHKFIHVSVIVVVKPKVPYPKISLCGNVGKNCYTELDLPFVECTVSGVRPNISLDLIARTSDGDKALPSDAITIEEGIGYTSSVTTRSIFHYSDWLVLLICRASSSIEILANDESIILIRNSAVNISQREVTPQFVERGTKLEMVCTNDDIGFLVWKQEPSSNDGHQKILLYAVFIGEQFNKVVQSDVMLGINGSLVIPTVDVQHEGRYSCVYGDGMSNDVRVYDVLVVVHPVPTYLVVNGCDPYQYCVLEGDHQGSLQCLVRGIRPLVELQWKTFHDSDAAAISFTNQQLTVKDNGNTFDVTLTSTYNLKDESRDRITVECTLRKEDKPMFDLTSKLDLMFVEETIPPTKQVNLPTTGSVLTWVTVVIVVFLVLLLLFGLLIKTYLYSKRPIKKTLREEEEMMSMFNANNSEWDHLIESQKIAPGKFLSGDKPNLEPSSFPGGGSEGIKNQFLKQLKEKYKDLYETVQPIPYIKERLHCVDRVFVEGGIEFLDSYKGETMGNWKKLDSYQNVFNDQRVQSSRRILEGEPGYGKSTVTLQFAYDWCNSKGTSALKDIEIMILLRLRQMGGVSSIYRAIKQFILPKDTLLKEEDIEKIMRNCPSAVVILDGFDEYPDQDITSSSDVMNIIARQMFQDIEVVTTTRSSFLPKKYPAITKRLRLTGFDDSARRYYIRKAVVGDDDEERVNKVEELLQANPILSDLCQVPLLFAIFAHMTHESENFRKLNSVTSFFRYMISCFHSHMRNKMDDENVRKYELFESEHHDLDKAAFDALDGSSQKIIWDKHEFCQLIGQEFYDQYIRIGILVEEESVHIIDDPGTPITQHVQYKTEVRFYHKLFCEWYAAHYLSSYLQKNSDVDLSEFLQYLDPFDVQYLYRFSCGLNADSAEKIITYLKNIEGGDKFAILCILEQTGKVNHIKETIRELCFEGVIISGYDSLLLQRSSMQLLEIAARNDIPIELVFLFNCFRSVDLSTAAIKTTSGLDLTSRIPVKRLEVSLTITDTTEAEVISILQFASMCPSLCELLYHGCVPPRIFTDRSTLSSLESRKVEGN